MLSFDMQNYHPNEMFLFLFLPERFPGLDGERSPYLIRNVVKINKI